MSTSPRAGCACSRMSREAFDAIASALGIGGASCPPHAVIRSRRITPSSGAPATARPRAASSNWATKNSSYTAPPMRKSCELGSTNSRPSRSAGERVRGSTAPGTVPEPRHRRVAPFRARARNSVARCHRRCHPGLAGALTSSNGSKKAPGLRGLSSEPTPGLEPGTPSLRVKCSTS